MANYLARLLDLQGLQDLKREMRRLGVDKGGIPIMSYKGVHRLILIEQVPTPAANIIKQEALARGGDLVTPWSAAAFEEPYVDVILIGSLTTLRSLISKLYRQYACDLPKIADAIQTVLMHTTPGYRPVSPKPARQGVMVEETLETLMGGRLPLEPGTHRAVARPTCAAIPGHTWRFGEQTYVVAPVEADDPAAWEQLTAAALSGAHIVELCGDSDRVAPLVSRTRVDRPEVLVAVATRRARVAETALDAGAQLLTAPGLPDEEADRPVDLWRVAAERGVPVSLAHSREIAPDADALSDIARFFHEALEQAVLAGVRESQVILDPGIPLCKTEEEVRMLTRRLRELTSFGRPLLYTAPGATAADAAPYITLAIAGGADFLRIRPGPETARIIAAADVLVRERSIS